MSYLDDAIKILQEKKWEWVNSTFESSLMEELLNLCQKESVSALDVEPLIEAIRNELLSHPERIANTGNEYLYSLNTTTLQKVFTKLVDYAVDLKRAEIQEMDLPTLMTDFLNPSLPEAERISTEEIEEELQKPATDNDIQAVREHSLIRCYRPLMVVGRNAWDQERVQSIIDSLEYSDLAMLKDRIGSDTLNLLLGDLFEQGKHFSQQSIEESCYGQRNEERPRPDVVHVMKNTSEFYDLDAEKHQDPFTMKLVCASLTGCECLILKEVNANRFWILHVEPFGGFLRFGGITHDLPQSVNVEMLVINKNDTHETMKNLLSLQKVKIVSEKDCEYNPESSRNEFNISVIFLPKENKIHILKEGKAHSTIEQAFPVPERQLSESITPRSPKP